MKKCISFLKSFLVCIVACLGSCTCIEAKTPLKKIAILAGAKSHGPAAHEYLKSSRLIKAMLERNGPQGLMVDIYQDWPEDPSVLDKVDVIMTISDGRDGHLYSEASFLLPERIPIIEKQMKRGCGLITFHFSTFAPDKYGEEVLEWTGGYFDWEDEKGERNWYSSILNQDTDVIPATPGHPISNGVKPFKINEEFYYNIRFKKNDPRLKPILNVPTLGSTRTNGNTVAWAVERADGGRGFGTTMGHHYLNWKNDNFRKLILNAIAWVAGFELPDSGIQSPFYNDKEVTRLVFKRTHKALILTGDNIEAHEWENTTPQIKSILEEKMPFHADVSVSIEDLAQYDLNDYDLLVLNYCNWNHPKPLSNEAKNAFTQYLKSGGGLMILHFSNGAFHYSLPMAPETDWPEFRKICRRVWDHHSNSSHDDFGKFTVNVTSIPHVITKKIRDFETTDELYFNQKGEDPIEPLLTAKSKRTGNAEALAWVYMYGNGRVFQTLLGHNARSYQSPEYRKLLQRAAKWSGKVFE